jgi:hypothetical protein
MKTVLHPWQMLLLILAGWINQQQQHARMVKKLEVAGCAWRIDNEIGFE